jgi:hypothetical protein
MDRAEEKNIESGGCFSIYQAVFSFSHYKAPNGTTELSVRSTFP